jgi:GAF domain-containing protein
MLDGDRVVETLEEEREGSASRDELLRTAVREIEASEDTYDWVGIYLLEGDELVLHSYVGEPTEHDRIEVGTGVCGTAVAEERDLNVPDVEEVDNYLSCSPDVRSEMVVLIRDGGDGAIRGQLDLDSHRPGAFDEGDRRELKAVADWLAELFDGER